MDILIITTQLILSLSIIVVLHEMGHFIPAKLFKTRVEKFYLFFNPWFSLFKVKKGETEYGLGWLPLGGFVKISGMIDESMDKEQMAKPPEPWEFRSKPPWQRLIIMTGGVIVNLILGIVIYIFALFTWGDDYIPNENLTYGIACDSLMLAQGFKDGDKILTIEGEKSEYFDHVLKDILIHDGRKIEVLRDGKPFMIELPEDIDYTIIGAGLKAPLTIRYPNVVDSIHPNTPAEKVGLQKGDSIVAINNEATIFAHDFGKVMNEVEGNKIDLTFYRDGIEKTVNVEIDEDKIIGFQRKDLIGESGYVKKRHISYSFGEAIPAGTARGFTQLQDYALQLKYLFSSAGIKQVGGFGTFAKLFGYQWDWNNFWRMTAFISIILALMNILPIPALDGGHVMFLLYEMVAGRPPNQKIMEYAQIVGMVLLLGLVLYANGNDIVRLFQ